MKSERRCERSDCHLKNTVGKKKGEDMIWYLEKREKLKQGDVILSWPLNRSILIVFKNWQLSIQSFLKYLWK